MGSATPASPYTGADRYSHGPVRPQLSRKPLDDGGVDPR